jgi:hypothetical protein
MSGTRPFQVDINACRIATNVGQLERTGLSCGASLRPRLARLFSLGRRDFFAVPFVLLERGDRFGCAVLSLGCRFAL